MPESLIRIYRKRDFSCSLKVATNFEKYLHRHAQCPCGFLSISYRGLLENVIRSVNCLKRGLIRRPWNCPKSINQAPLSFDIADLISNL